MTIASALLAAGSLVGESIAPDPKWATLPLSGLFLFTMLATLPASLLMQRRGRRFGFVLAAIILMLSGAGAALAIYVESFVGFIASLMGIGVAAGFFQFFRFAAVDVAPAKYASKAISWVLAGGLLAAFLGPNLAAQTQMMDIEHPFLITMLFSIPIGLIMLVLVWKMKLPMPTEEEVSGQQRRLKEIISQPVFIVAVVSAMVAYGVMTLLMTATPLAMKGHGFVFGQTAFIIQWHLVGMFAPSFFTGFLIERFGVLQIMLMGTLAYLCVVALNMQTQTMTVYWFALVLLGVGWNFTFIGATTLLQEAWKPAEKGRVQGINDTLVYSVSAIAAMGSGILYAEFGWERTNIISLPFTFIAAALIFYLLMARKRENQPVL